MSKHTFHIGPMHLVIDVEQLSDSVWTASTFYKGERFVARSDTRQRAIAALLIALKSEISTAKG
jgi:hypothetical protein